MKTHHPTPDPAATLAATLASAIQAALSPAPDPAPLPIQPEPVPLPMLYTVKGMTEVEPALTVGGIRADLFSRKTNGLAESGAVIRRGRILLLHRERYMNWMISNGDESK